MIELLIGMALTGIILTLLLNWQTSVLQISTRSNALAQSMSELNDLSGYIGDRIRSAARVRVATSGLTVNGKSCSTNTPCLAVVAPVETDDGKFTQYTLYVYRMEPRSEVNSEDKVNSSWAENNVQVLREYRATKGSTPAICEATPAEFKAQQFRSSSDDSDVPANNKENCKKMLELATATAFSNTQPYLVSDFLTPADDLGTTKPPFAYDAAARAVTLNFRYKQQASGQTTYLPVSEPFTLRIQARNVLP